VGSFISSRAPDKYIRPAITFVIFASGLKYVGLGTTALGWVLCATLLGTAAIWVFYVRPWQSGALSTGAGTIGDKRNESATTKSPPLERHESKLPSVRPSVTTSGQTGVYATKQGGGVVQPQPYTG
jgi:hypothetical protein